MADPPLPPQARSSDPPRSSPPPRACLGATFFSRASATSGKAPTCAGISRRLSEDTSLEAASLPPEVAPDGDFSFCCLGLASYRQGQVPEKAASVTSGAPSTSATEAVLPQCMGVQIIRAQAPLPPVPPALVSERLGIPMISAMESRVGLGRNEVGGRGLASGFYPRREGLSGVHSERRPG